MVKSSAFTTAAGPRQLRAAYAVLAALLLAAVAWEWLSTHAVYKRATRDLERVKAPGTSQCDKIGVAVNLNEYLSYAATVQWRRGLIASCAVVGLLPLLTGMRPQPAQSLVLALLTWVVFTSVSGFNDYHMRTVGTTVIDESLRLAVLDYSDSEQAQCSAELIAPFSGGPI